MDSSLPPTWVKISQEDFDKVLATVDYTRDGWTNCLEYYVRWSPGRKSFAMVFKNGDIWIDPGFL